MNWDRIDVGIQMNQDSKDVGIEMNQDSKEVGIEMNQDSKDVGIEMNQDSEDVGIEMRWLSKDAGYTVQCTEHRSFFLMTKPILQKKIEDTIVILFFFDLIDIFAIHVIIVSCWIPNDCHRTVSCFRHHFFTPMASPGEYIYCRSRYPKLFPGDSPPPPPLHISLAYSKPIWGNTLTGYLS